MRFDTMDARLDQFLQTMNHHRVALGGLAIALTLGSMTGGYLKPNGLLEEPKAAQLISSTVHAEATPEIVVEPFPADTRNRPWVAGTDALKARELPPLAASYDDIAYSAPPEPVMPDSTPSVTDYAVDAVDEAPAMAPPAA